jgi:hypothetical protein
MQPQLHQAASINLQPLCFQASARAQSQPYIIRSWASILFLASLGIHFHFYRYLGTKFC